MEGNPQLKLIVILVASDPYYPGRCLNPLESDLGAWGDAVGDGGNFPNQNPAPIPTPYTGKHLHMLKGNSACHPIYIGIFLSGEGNCRIKPCFDHTCNFGCKDIEVGVNGKAEATLTWRENKREASGCSHLEETCKVVGVEVLRGLLVMLA